MVFWQILAGILGCFLLVWSINLRRMSVAQRPRFSRWPSFRFSAPLLGGGLGLAGFGLAIQRSPLWGGLSCAISLILCWLLLKHDQYSAVIRILYDDYLTLKKQNPPSKEFDLLFSIVKSRSARRHAVVRETQSQGRRAASADVGVPRRRQKASAVIFPTPQTNLESNLATSPDPPATLALISPGYGFIAGLLA